MAPTGDMFQGCGIRRSRIAATTYRYGMISPGGILSETKVGLPCTSQQNVGGSVWESNPPSLPRWDGSPALKTGRITGPLAPPQDARQRIARYLHGTRRPPLGNSKLLVSVGSERRLTTSTPAARAGTRLALALAPPQRELLPRRKARPAARGTTRRPLPTRRC